MADSTVIAIDPPQPADPVVDFHAGLSVPPLDENFFSQVGDGALGDNLNDIIALEDLDFDFSFDDLCLPSSEGLDGFLDHIQLQQPHFQSGHCADFAQFGPTFDQFLNTASKSASPELRHVSGEGDFSGDHSSNGSRVLTSASPGMGSRQISGYLNIPSPDSNGSNRGSSENCGGDEKPLNCHSPESQGSGNCMSDAYELNNYATRLVSSSGNSNNSSYRIGVFDQKIRSEVAANSRATSSLLKRKKEGEDLVNNCDMQSRINKCMKPDSTNEYINNSISNNGPLNEEEKKKGRLMRNRESAQLSRQRKKQYVEELEDKVRTMHSTIQDLNAKISYFMAENATLRQQFGGSGASTPPLPVAPPPPGMYPHPAMIYPWMPYCPPYMMKPQGSQVPLVPIPRLKPQQPAQAPKTSKKVESKKQEGSKTKKVAGVSFIGLLFFIFLFGGLVPMINMRYGGVRESFTGGNNDVGSGFYDKHHGRVLMVNGTEYGEKHGGIRNCGGLSSLHGFQRGNCGRIEPNPDELVQMGNGSEPLVASLYVPRNDKLVKIDGNLIIHSVMASEKAMVSGKGSEETGLALPRGDLVPAIPAARHSHLRALASSSANRENVKSTATDGNIQKWFREGLAGPMLSSGMCTEVFQFDVSSAIVPASTSSNITDEQGGNNSTDISNIKNRRILNGLPIPIRESSQNLSIEQMGRNPQKENLNIGNNASSMVVSVLVDPREASGVDVDGMMGVKSISHIFVVVLIDSVKYVTYSCMIPFLGSTPHLVTT